MKGRAMSMLAWAAREVGRRPWEAALTGVAMACLVTVTATVLLLDEAWTATVTGILDEGPSLVVRRLDGGGWQPLDAASAVAAAGQVIGVVEATPRVWGVASTKDKAVTVVGVDAKGASLLQARGIPVPSEGNAVVGPGVLVDPAASSLTLTSVSTLTVPLQATLDEAHALTLYDVVLLPMADARALFGLGTDEASDLAVTVFHQEEEEAILPDLTAAFPWPVAITTKRESIGSAVAAISKRGGLVMVLLVPAVLALGLLVAGVARARSGSRREIGLYKALGWSTGDLVRLELTKSLAVGVPSVLAGLAVAWGLVFWPGITWPGALLLGWQTPPPPLVLEASGAVVVLLAVGGLVLAPWLLAALLPVVRGATADPGLLVKGGRR